MREFLSVRPLKVTIYQSCPISKWPGTTSPQAIQVPSSFPSCNVQHRHPGPTFNFSTVAHGIVPLDCGLPQHCRLGKHHATLPPWAGTGIRSLRKKRVVQSCSQRYGRERAQLVGTQRPQINHSWTALPYNIQAV